MFQSCVPNGLAKEIESLTKKKAHTIEIVHQSEKKSQQLQKQQQKYKTVSAKHKQRVTTARI